MAFRQQRRTAADPLPSFACDASLTPDDIRQRLAVHEEIVHSTIEIHHCPDVVPIAAGRQIENPATVAFHR